MSDDKVLICMSVRSYGRQVLKRDPEDKGTKRRSVNEGLPTKSLENK